MKEGKGLRVLLDTSAWIDALREDGDPQVREQVRAVALEGSATFCDMVLLELWNGAGGDAEVAYLSELRQEIECVDTNPAVWELARQMAQSCRKRGITVPATDLLIAACAEFHSLSLLHNDAHFDQIGRALEGSGG